MASLTDRLKKLEACHAKPDPQASPQDDIAKSRARLQQMILERWDAGKSVAGPLTADEHKSSLAHLLKLLKERLHGQPT